MRGDTFHPGRICRDRAWQRSGGARACTGSVSARRPIRLPPLPPTRAAPCLPIWSGRRPASSPPICRRAARRRARSLTFAPSKRRSKSSRCARRSKPKPRMPQALSIAGSRRASHARRRLRTMPQTNSRRQWRNRLSRQRRRCRSSSFRTKPRRASMPPPAPISALSSGWSGSGRTISASRPTRSWRWPALTSAKRSARMCSAASPICCRRSKAIPAMLFYLDNVQSMGAEFDRRHQSRQGAQRKSRPRDPRTAHARRPQRLHAGRRHELRQRASPAGPGFRPDEPEHGGEFVFVKRLHEPGDQDRARQALSRHRRRAGPRRARRSGASSGDGAAHRAKARARISSPTSRRRRWSPSSQRHSATPTAI